MPPFTVVWARIVANADQEMHTISGLPFHYEMNGPNTVRIIRGAMNRVVGRGQFEQAYNLGLPLDGPGVITLLQAPAYIWGILHDHRIRQNDW